MHSTTGRALTTYITTLATHLAMHGACDHIVQTGADAAAKREPDGQMACVRHVASYTAVQVGVLTAVTRALGERLPWRAVAAGAAVNAVTHYVTDRGPALRAIARLTGKTGYIESCSVMRPDGRVHETGPGSAWLEIDAALHHTCAVAASLLTAWLTGRITARREER